MKTDNKSMKNNAKFMKFCENTMKTIRIIKKSMKNNGNSMIG